ncbi:MAG: hypothetical protein CR979_01440 [Propionibacterium sp.]|nr:MAG: hypothetical protein CR979_01440 [Propionibacterium sp.]
MPEPDDSLPAFLERVALVADSDQLPGDGGGVVTLMTLHTAKGLEFDTVFLTGLEEGLFPHQRSLTNRTELEEERRLAYVGITRARQRLYLTRAGVRANFGLPQYYPASRFLDEIPNHVMDWRRIQTASTSWSASSANSRLRNASPFAASSHQPRLTSVSVGDRVIHSSFGMGTVLNTSGAGDNIRVEVDFGSAGIKRLSLRHAPMEKL